MERTFGRQPSCVRSDGRFLRALSGCKAKPEYHAPCSFVPREQTSKVSSQADALFAVHLGRRANPPVFFAFVSARRWGCNRRNQKHFCSAIQTIHPRNADVEGASASVDRQRFRAARDGEVRSVLCCRLAGVLSQSVVML